MFFPSFVRYFIPVFALAASSACQKYSAPASSFEVAVQGLHSAALDNSGEYAVVASINHGGSLWRTEDGERLYNWNHSKDETSTIIAADIDATQRWAVTAEPNTLVLWNRQSGEGERFWTTPGEVLDIALGPNADFALLGLDTHKAVIFDVLRGGILQTLVHDNRVRSVDLSADGTIAVTGSEDYQARTWDVASGKLIHSFKHDDDVQLVELSTDGSLVLSVSKYDKAVVWLSETGETVGELALHAEQLKRGLRFTAARFSEDKRFLLTGRPDQWVELWSLATMNTVARWKVPKRDYWKPTSAAILAVAFSQNEGEYFAVASNGFVYRLTLEKH